MVNYDELINRCMALANKGLSVSSVAVRSTNVMIWDAAISINTFIPQGEGDGRAGPYTITVDRKKLPKGVTCGGFDRWPDETWQIVASSDEIEIMIKRLAKYGDAQDWAKHTRDGYVCYIAKPNKWFRLSG